MSCKDGKEDNARVVPYRAKILSVKVFAHQIPNRLLVNGHTVGGILNTIGESRPSHFVVIRDIGGLLKMRESEV